MKKSENFVLISSHKYYIKLILGYSIAGIDVLLAGIVFSRGASRSFLSKIIDIPYGLEVVLYFVVFILLIFSVVLIINKENNKGVIIFKTKNVLLNRKCINLSNTLTIYLNPSKEKRIYQRSINDGGGNNWIEFIENGKTLKFEFLIPSLKKEEEMKEIIEAYKKNGYNVFLKSAPPSFWDKINS